jgi:hypothetical protein
VTIIKQYQGTIVYIYNPSTLEAEQEDNDSSPAHGYILKPCLKKKKKKERKEVRCLWLMPVILATQEAEIRWIEFRSQPRQIVSQDVISKTKTIIKRAGGVAQGIGPEFKL